MSNSKLVDYTKLSPSNSGRRKYRIDRITPHCVVGQCTAEGLGDWFAKKSTQASSNYGIDRNGRVGMYVEEKNRSWCSSSEANDQRAVTIECASNLKPPYAMRNVVYNKLIDLCVDICRRNGKKKLIWFGNKKKTLEYKPKADEMVITVHRWFANKSCPGDWLYSRLGNLAKTVTDMIKDCPPPPPELIFRVQTGSYIRKAYADAHLAKVKAAGFDAYMVRVGNIYKVQVGAFKIKANADIMAARVKKAGFKVIITTETGIPVSSNIASNSFAVGDRVKLASNATVYGTSKKFASFVYSSVLYLRELKGNRAVISTKKTGEITGAVHKKYLKKIT